MNYKVYQGEELKQTVTSKTAVMNGLQPNRTYDFSVEPENTQTVGGKTRYTHVAYANMTHISNEGSSFTLSERATVRFGAGNQWVYKTFDAGTYPADNYTFGRDPYVGMGKSAEVVSDFSVGQGSNKTYIGFYTDFTETDSNDPSQYTWNPNAKTSVTTRGIRFNIPKTLTVGSTVTLRYEEYPLGIVPIGNEPSGYFGGGNKQNLSAKVISTANGSSVVEVAGNVIEVGGKNLLINTSSSSTNGKTTLQGASSVINGAYSRTDSYEQVTAPSSGEFYYRFVAPDSNNLYGLTPGETYTLSGSASHTSGTLQSRAQYNNGSGWINLDYLTDLGTPVSDGSVFTPFSYTFTIPVGATGVYFSLQNYDYTNGGLFRFKDMNLEIGTIATPYASFIDGDTFTAQPDGTYALFSEYKALYY